MSREDGPRTLSIVKRIRSEETLVDRVADALRRHHPASVKLARFNVRHAAALTDEKLLAAIARLDAWLAGDTPSALPSPEEEGVARAVD